MLTSLILLIIGELLLGCAAVLTTFIFITILCGHREGGLAAASKLFVDLLKN